MVHIEEPGQVVEQSGPKHGFAKPALPNALDVVLESAPEISALEHAIRMAPASWCFDTDDDGGIF